MSAYAVGTQNNSGLYGVSGNSDSRNSVQQKADDIRKKIEDLEKQRESYKDGSKEAASLDNRIHNLEGRLQNFEKKLEKTKDKPDDGKCETCENRKYQDESDDSTVSFQNATKLSPQAASAQVRAHENQHVRHNAVEARENNRKVVSSSVTIHTDICPECGKTYVSGGTTKTVTKNAVDLSSKFSAGKEKSSVGKMFDSVA